MPIDTTLGERIKTLRSGIGWSTTDLAKRCELDQSYLSRLESGKYENPGVFTVAAIADAFGMTIDELLHSKPNPSVLKPEDRFTSIESRLSEVEEKVFSLMKKPGRK